MTKRGGLRGHKIPQRLCLVVAWDQNGRNSPTHRCTSPWGSSQSDYPAHRCPLFGAWRVPRVSEPQLTVRVLSQTPSVPFLSPRRDRPAFRVALPRETPRLTEITGRLPSFTQGPAASPQPRAGGGFAGRSGLRATEPMVEAGWGKRPAAEPKCLHLRACDTTLHSQCTHLRGKSEHSAAASKKRRG